MSIFYKPSAKELFEARNKIFVEVGITALNKSGFEKSPYKGTRFGKYDASLYAYDLCRVNDNSQLEFITTYISKKDRWIKIYLNIFQLKPNLGSLVQLKDLNEMQFYLPPNKLTEMRLRSDDFKGMPLFQTVHHKIKSFYTKNGFQKRINSLSELIETDMTNINHFIKRWHELHVPMVTDWEGKEV